MPERKLITQRIDKINPLEIETAFLQGAYDVLKTVLKWDRLDVIDEIEKSRLRGRGGAGFPVAIKMTALAKEKDTPKYIVCNADEGEPGNFKDRYLMEHDPHMILEGMLLSAYATHATKGYIYIRGEYDESIQIMNHAIKQMREHDLLGDHILGSKFAFDLEVRSGAGSYVCGEEFALLESIEGKAGRTRVKPPFPTSRGLFNKPTLINNVETFATLPTILKMGGEAYSLIGTPSSTGTKLISLSGNVKKKGVYEIPFGISMREVITKLGGGVPNNRKIKMVQLGGACGPMIPEYMLDMIIDFERFEEFESKCGAGAIIVIDDRFDLFDLLVKVSEFFTHESCGKCTPCREGNYQLVNVLKKFQNKQATEKDLISLESQARVMHQTSLCGLGQTAPTAIISTLHYFRWEFINRVEESFAKGGTINA